MSIDKREKLQNVGIIIIFFVISVISSLRLNGKVGLYLDAVNPDYMAVQLLNPNNYSSSMSFPYIWFPLLGQVYHGTVTMCGSLLASILTGQTGTGQLYVTNSIYGAIAATLIFGLMREIGVKKAIAFTVTVILLLSPNMISMYATQFYIELPGVIFILLMMHMAIRWKRKSVDDKKLFMIGLFGGLAVYSYFNYIFCAPTVIGLIGYESAKRKDKSIWKNEIILLTGYIAGAAGYIVGYVSAIISKVETPKVLRQVIVLGTILLLFITLKSIYSLCISGKTYKNVVIVTLFCVGGGILGAIVYSILHIYTGYFAGLDVAGEKAGLGTRIGLVYEHLAGVLGHSALEYLVMYRNVVQGMILVPLVTCIVIVVMFVIRRKKVCIKEDERYQFIVALLIGCVIYLLCCIPMVTRMQNQHFICMIFSMYLLLGVGTSVVAENTKLLGIWKKRGTYIGWMGVMLIIMMHLMNQTAVLWALDSSDCDSYNIYYSTAINSLAERALEKKEAGEKQYYVFPEWGILAGFDYLTRNEIAFNGSINLQQMQQLCNDEGYQIVVCYWERDNTEVYRDNLLEIFDMKQISSSYVEGNYGNILEICVNSIEAY